MSEVSRFNFTMGIIGTILIIISIFDKTLHIFGDVTQVKCSIFSILGLVILVCCFSSK